MLSSFESILKPFFKKELYKTNTRKQYENIFPWIPFHGGIAGNERVDTQKVIKTQTTGRNTTGRAYSLSKKSNWQK